MSIRKAVYAMLSAAESDVFPLVAEQETTDPYVVFSMRRSPVRTQDGIGVQDVELTLNIYGSNLSDCIALADTMYTGIESVTGTYATETLMASNWVSESDFFIDELQKYGITQEYFLRFT
jgi:hypothetical protein